jgi:type IV fimbrial biogenesis protein FimT
MLISRKIHDTAVATFQVCKTPYKSKEEILKSKFGLPVDMRGFTLIELGITLLVVGLLLSVGIPSASVWIRNTQVRSVAEGLVQGLNVARAEALRRNRTVEFVLTNAAPDADTRSYSKLVGSVVADVTGRAWVVRSSPKVAGDSTTMELIQSRTPGEMPGSVSVQADTGLIAFNGLGFSSATTASRIAVRTDDANMCVENGGAVRCLSVEVQKGGSIRICDKTLQSSDPRSC